METMTEKTLKVGKLFRDFEVRKSDIDTEKRTVALSFSSETDAVERWFGVEVLDHSPGAVDLKRLKRSGALLIDHDPRNQVGVIEEVTVGADRKGRAVVRFGRSAKAEEIFQDVIDGIRKNVSCGYEPKEMKLERQQENGPDVYRVTQWTPFEISLVSIPADIEVGIGRSKDDDPEIKVVIPQQTEQRSAEQAAKAEPPAPVVKASKEERTMSKMCEVCGGEVVDGKCNGTRHEELEKAVARARSMSVEEMEGRRKKAIENLCKTNKLDEKYREMWIGQGASLEQVADDILKIMEERGKTNPQPASRLGLSPAETKQFSLLRAINACYTKDWKDAGFELEVSRAVAQKIGKHVEPTQFYVPFEYLSRQSERGSYRDLSAGTTNAGGYLVDTQNMGFIEMLRKRSVCMRMGARDLGGLTSNITIPKQTAGATAFWLTNEATQITEGSLTFAQISMSPNTIGAYVEISRQLMLQSSPGAEGIVSDDLAKQVALAVDVAGLEGSGTEQPTGIANTASIGAFTGGTLSFAYVMNAQEDVAAADVIPVRGGYVATPAVASICMQRVKFTSTASPLWEGNIYDGQMCGYPAMSSNQLTAGTMIFGDWSELILASWGTLAVEVNPFANFQAGIIGVRAMYSMDVAVRWPAAFSRATSIT